MRVLIAPDKFKGSLTAQEVCKAIEAGLRAGLPELSCVLIPLADGGEGTLEILTQHFNGYFINVKVHDPLLRLVDAHYGISSDGKTAFVDMAGASGLRLLKIDERNVMKTSTMGTGELIKNAIDRGITNVVVGIGGSATNDGAAGAARPLGFEFFDVNNKIIEPTGENLIHIKSIKTDKVDPRLKTVKFTAICDVENPLTGAHGAAFVYAPQKGATPEQLTLLDDGLKNLAEVIQHDLGISINDIPGAGAGGGFGGGVIAFFNGTLKKGIDVVFDYTNFAEEVRKADLIITGEGKLDTQTLHGKVVAGVTAMARRYGKKVICIAGRNELSSKDINALGVTRVFSLVDYASAEDAMKNAYEILRHLVKNQISKLL